ncbi:MAG: hypothetical protein FJY67_01820 [Calditrichaeota bacterium]|nr:hypothetical protein [Calditrichota bacterium]
MSWTDSTLVLNHLLNLDQPPAQHHDVPILIGSNGIGILPHRGLVPQSEVVKRPLPPSEIVHQQVILNGENWASLAHLQILPGEIVVAADAVLQQIYSAENDFAVDWEGGRIRRIEDSAIPDASSVEIWYRSYEELERDVDYDINYATGEVFNVTGNRDLSDTLLFVDYQLPAAAGVQALIPQAITEVEAKILPRLKPPYGAASTDQGLITSATEMTLSAVCRGLAARALLDGATSPEGRARSWMQLANSYETTAWQTLRPFLTHPVQTPAGKSGNSSWEWSER